MGKDHSDGQYQAGVIAPKFHKSRSANSDNHQDCTFGESTDVRLLSGKPDMEPTWPHGRFDPGCVKTLEAFVGATHPRPKSDIALQAPSSSH
jgi:hypothetical protein